MNRKILLIALLTFGLLITGMSLMADTQHGRSIEDVLSEIRTELGLGKNQSIDPDRVSDKLLEELGEAVMSYMVPNERQHEWMDNMMGGEGSESLANMHRIMGYRYLQNGGIGNLGFGPMMMGGGMWDGDARGRWGSGWGSMMGAGYPGSYYGWLVLAVIIGLIVAVIILAVFLVRKNRSGYNELSRFGEGRGTTNALEILKESYARGEISREEYLKKREDIIKED